jgi:hypothetical protein
MVQSLSRTQLPVRAGACLLHASDPWRKASNDKIDSLVIVKILESDMFFKLSFPVICCETRRLTGTTWMIQPCRVGWLGLPSYF